MSLAFLSNISFINTSLFSLSISGTKQIEEKIRTHAFSGGQETKALQEQLGADLEKDVAYQWLTFFMEDDEELKAIGKEREIDRLDFILSSL
jgi:tryptophanyl-tRNA synthetase